ncbi:FG-GAP-like repeat-containing protein [Streptomyces sp. NPDC047042]|uniref:FG-GAP-like repeat-containing protein n=1 Tax=Streptomyces sp. NPDC047042 TaxID=3154807 RepID=UPI0033E8DBBA
MTLRATRNGNSNRYRKQFSKQFSEQFSKQHGKLFRKRSATGAVSVAAALAVVAGLLQFTAGPAAVAADDRAMPSVTLPGAHRTAPRRAFLATADNTGYLATPRYYDSDASTVWIGRDGSSGQFPRAYFDTYNGGFGLEMVPPTWNVWQIRHYSTGKATRFTLLDGDLVTEVFAENRLLVSRQVEGKWTLHLLEMPAGGGRPVDRLVTGVDDDFTGNVFRPTSDNRGAAFVYQNSDRVYRAALFDFETASVTYVPYDDGLGALDDPHMAADRVLFTYQDKAYKRSLYIVDRDHPEVPGHRFDVPEGVWPEARAIGDWVLYPDGGKKAIRAVPVTGGPARTLLTASTGTLIDGADGSFTIEGGTDAKQWAIQRVTLGPDGAPTAKPVVPLPPVSVYEAGGVAVDQGRVLLGTERADATSPVAGTDLTASALSLAADGTLTAASPKKVRELDYVVWESDGGIPIKCYEECLRLTGTGEGDISHPVDPVSAVVAASGPYRVVIYAGGQQVRDGDKVLARGSWPAAALWGNTLWTAGTDSRGRPVLDRFSLPSMRKLGSLSLGSCLPSDLQVVGRYIYWSCGRNAPAYVYDQVTRAKQTVPRGYAKLADGYLVSQDDKAGKLLITYLRGAVPANRVRTDVLGPLPSPPYALPDRRGRFWNVDRFGGPVAYLTASGDVTVKWPKVTTSPFAVTDAILPTPVDLCQGKGFEGVWQLTRPAANWKLTITTSGGAAVRTFTGGLARGKLAVTWDGRARNGAVVRTGSYRMRLTARPVNGGKSTLLYDKQVPVRSLERHEFGRNRDGIGDLITFDSAGQLGIAPGSGRGTIDRPESLGGGWPTSSTFVPFGNLSGPWCNDLLVRDSAGQLTRYNGTCGDAFTPRTWHRTLGTGFGAYDVLTSPGDLTGDGHPDLIARDRAGVLWRYAGDGRGGLTARVKVAAGLGGYTRLVGAGDMNGDGIGDMVGLDRANVLWRWLGNGKGAFGSRTRIATGISVNALAVPGDLNGDGRPDLVGRDSAGSLWRWSGTPSATFGTKTRIATDWNGYTGLY